jgi:flagellar protein FliS
MNNPYSRYTSTSISTGNEAQQLIFVFDEVLKLLYKAKKAIDAGEIEEKYKAIDKAANIFMLLRTGVSSTEHDLVKGLDNFYAATGDQLLKLNSKPSPAEECSKIIELVKKVRDALLQSAQTEGFI